MMYSPPLPNPLTSCPHALQINRPPVKLNLLTCQVRPHSEEKKCFDLVTRECPERDAMAGVGVFDPEAPKLQRGTPFLEASVPERVFPAPSWPSASPAMAPWHPLPFGESPWLPLQRKDRPLQGD